MKIAMIRLADRLRETCLPARLLLQVHDELVLEVERAALDEVADLTVRTMETAYELSVPLRAEVQAGDNWEEMTPLALSVPA
jgi:DNA polymerase-1